MKSTHAGIVLILVMLLLVLAALFWFLYSDYDAVRERANTADSRATQAAAMAQEAGQLRGEADQVKGTRSVLEADLATAVFNQEKLAQEAVDDQQTIQQLETRAATQIKASVPEVVIVSPAADSTINLSTPVELVVVAVDPNGVQAVNIVFDNNPSLEIPTGGATSVTIQESWPLSAAGVHTAVVTAVNGNNISSQVVAVSITAEDNPTSQQVADEVANIIGPVLPQTNDNEAQVSAENGEGQANITPIILQAFDFAAPQATEQTSNWGVYCESATAQDSISPSSQEIIDSPAQELALVRAIAREWQESRFQFSQLLAAAPHDDARAALCALAAGHERWLLEEYIRRAPVERQAALRENLTPQMSFERSDALAAQQNFGAVYGPAFINGMAAASGATAVLDVWNRPPQASVYILNPGHYAANEALQTAVLPDLALFLGDEWTAVTSDVLGAFMLAQYLENGGMADGGETAVAGWRGDRYVIYQQGDDGPILLALQINWATEQDAQAFAVLYEEGMDGRLSAPTTMQNSLENGDCWSGVTEETICIFTHETQTLIIKAPESGLAVNAMAEAIKP